MSDKKEKLERPFYELPAHIKPCSKIIQETRLQLSTRGKGKNVGSGSSGSGDGQSDEGISSRFSSASSNSRHRTMSEMMTQRLSAGSGDSSSFEEYFDAVSSPPSSTAVVNTRDRGGGGLPGIRPVHTQRPKTGADHDIWGVSSRKRPPSAITLSRLSLEDFEDEFSSVPNNSNGSSPLSLSHIASAGLGRPLKMSIARGNYVEYPEESEDFSSSPLTAEDNSIRMMMGNAMSGGSGKSIRQVEETTQRIKGLSVSSNSGSAGRAASNYKDNEEMDRSEGLIPAVNYLQSLVNNGNSSSNSSGAANRPMKAQVIAALQQVKSNVGEVQDCPTEVKHRLLKLIFKLVERNQQDEDVVFWASFVLLHCKIMGNNLTTVFKMVFKASRSKEYWAIIQETEYLDVFMESFGQICPLTQTESMIYGYGTLKFICMEKNVLMRIVELNLIPIMTLHLKLLNYELTKKITEVSKNEQEFQRIIPESIFNGVFQLTSILRSVVGEDSSLHLAVTSGLLEELCNCLEWTVDDIDILSNIVRILSVVSGDNLCCQVISSNQTFIQSVVTTIQMWHSKDDVVVRLTYCLGNLLAHCENMRIKLFEEPSCYNMILHLINYYLERSSPISEDILIKTIRILANWSLNPVIGQDICEDPHICQLLNNILRNKDFSDELLTCVISTLNNTTFYKDYTLTDMNSVQTAEYLYEYLTWKNLEGRTEVMKVLGNLTRNHVIRETAAENVDKLLVSLADENDEELLCATVGVLMNIIVETRASEEFITHQGIDYLLRLMRVKDDLALNLMICQFLWNIHISCEKLNEDKLEGVVAVPSSSVPIKNPINNKQRLEIRHLIRTKLESLSQIQSNTNPSPTQQLHDFPFLDLEPEYRSVAERLFDKLIVNE